MTLSEALRRDAAGDWLSWTDSEIGELERLRKVWAIGRQVRNLVVARRAAGEPFDELVELLRDVKGLCTRQLENWQPTERQRRMPQ
jgi:hypothetical protein